MSCKKVKFSNEKFALDYIGKLRKTSVRDIVPARAYLCPECMSWHLTSKPDTTVENLSGIISGLRSELDQSRGLIMDLERKSAGLVKTIRAVINVSNRDLMAGVSKGKNKNAVAAGANLMRELLKDVLNKHE